MAARSPPVLLADLDALQAQRCMEIVKNLEFRIRRYGSWRQTKLQLPGKEPKLFAEVDRLDAERELRVGLLAPLLTLTIVVAIRVAP